MLASVPAVVVRGRNTPWTGHYPITGHALIHSHPRAVWSLCAHLHDNKNARFHCSYAFYTRTVPRHNLQAFLKKGSRVKTLSFLVKMMAAMVDYRATRVVLLSRLQQNVDLLRPYADMRRLIFLFTTDRINRRRSIAHHSFGQWEEAPMACTV